MFREKANKPLFEPQERYTSLVISRVNKLEGIATVVFDIEGTASITIEGKKTST